MRNRRVCRRLHSPHHLACPTQTDLIPAGRGPVGEPARVAWWKQKLWKLPLAAWIVLVTALIAIGIVAAVGGDDDAAIDEADAPTERTRTTTDEEGAAPTPLC